jgi:hypothetical protein
MAGESWNRAAVLLLAERYISADTHASINRLYHFGRLSQPTAARVRAATAAAGGARRLAGGGRSGHRLLARGRR